MSGADWTRRSWVALTVTLSLLLCASRLTRTLGYEHAFLSGLLVSVLGGHLGVIAGRRGELGSLWARWRSAGLHSGAIALIPLVIGSLNGLRVGSCDSLEGATYYLLLPMVTAWVASGWGLVTAALGRGLGTYLIAYLTSLLYVGAQVWWTPIVDPFHPLFAYYPGAIYDELLMVDGRLLWSRLEDLLWVGCTLSVLSWRRRPSELKRRRWALLSGVALIAALLNGGRLDLRRTASHVQARLGGELKTEHFRIYYPQRWEPSEVSRLATELEFLYQELSAFFGQGSSREISAYLYSSVRQKKRLMGAGRTRIAKPWQYAIHVHAPAVGQSVLKHELAHVFSADIAPSPHHLSLYRGVFPHMPLIEGLAEAATWSEGALTPHQLTAALRQEGLAPSMSRLLSPQGFYLSSSSVAYTMCGSFMRFYRERRGQEALATLYATGGAQGLEEPERIIGEWEAFIDAVALNAQERRVVAQLMNRPSIFYKVCAHEVAEVRGEASRASAERDWAEALRRWRQLQELSEGDRGATLGELRALYQLGRGAELQALVEGLIDTEDLPLRLRLEEWRLDLSWLTQWGPQQRKSPEAILSGYDALLTQLPARSDRRRVSVKRSCAARHFQESPASLSQGEEGGAPLSDSQRVARLLIDPSGGERPYEEALEELASRLAEPWPVLTYLRARAASFAARDEEALKLLNEALSAPLNERDLTYESERLIAHILFASEPAEESKLRESSRRFQALSERADLKLTEGERALLSQWSRRAEWFATHHITDSASSGVKSRALR